MKKYILSMVVLAALTIVSCSKSDIAPAPVGMVEVELIEGAHVFFSTTDTTVAMIGPSGAKYLPGIKPSAFNHGPAEAVVRVQGVKFKVQSGQNLKF